MANLRKQVDMGHRTQQPPGTLCSAPGCLAVGVAGAPVPLCPTHLRETYEFAAALIGDRRADVIEQQRADREALAAEIANGSQPHDRVIGYVYFIRFSDRVKIGWSANPHERIGNLPFDEVLAVVPGTMQDERAYHAKFHHLRERGEWFRAEPALVDFATALHDGQ